MNANITVPPLGARQPLGRGHEATRLEDQSVIVPPLSAAAAPSLPQLLASANAALAAASVAPHRPWDNRCRKPAWPSARLRAPLLLKRDRCKQRPSEAASSAVRWLSGTPYPSRLAAVAHALGFQSDCPSATINNMTPRMSSVHAGDHLA